MTSPILRPSRGLCALPFSRIGLSRQTRPANSLRRSLIPAATTATATAAPFHISSSRLSSSRSNNNKKGPPERANFQDLDVLGNTPVPATSVDMCTREGFHLNSGTKVLDGSGVLLVAGEVFRWRPWVAKGSKTLVNERWQWDVPAEAFGAFSLLWPRPDLLMLGVGPDIRPISPETRKYIADLGMRVEVLDTRNAAAQFNLLATERGVEDVAAALIPLGWKDGEGVV